MKIILTTLILIIITINSYSQITLEKEYVNGGIEGIVTAFIANNTLYYYTVEGEYSGIVSIVLYDESHVAIKTININIDGITHINGVFLASDKLFNNDDNIEFVISYQYSGGSDMGVLALINDEGTKLMDLGDYNRASYIKTPSGKYKLITHYETDASGMNVYSLPGTLTSNQEEILKKTQSLAYPNPARNFINLKFERKGNNQLIVTDIKGRTVVVKDINPSLNEFKLNTTNFNSGIYLYQVGKQKGKFIIR